MGYSISVIAKNEESLIKMWNFLQDNYVEPKKLFKKKHNSSRLAYSLDKKENRLSYDHSKFAIGFDYNACDPEREYVYSVIRWISLKIGKRKEFKNLGKLSFYVYDGSEDCPVIVDKSNYSLLQESFDLSEKYKGENWFEEIVAENKKNDELINKEIERLEIEYNKK